MQDLRTKSETQQHENKKTFDKMQQEISDLKLQLQATDILLYLFNGEIIEERP
jgi:hypothetical protein